MSPVICLCNSVDRDEILAFIRANPAITPKEITGMTGASGSCGRCRPVINKLIRQAGNTEKNLSPDF
jgi:nitrite reductase (NADH) large subunit